MSQNDKSHWMPFREYLAHQVLRDCYMLGIRDEETINEIIKEKLKEYDDRSISQMDRNENQEE